MKDKYTLVDIVIRGNLSYGSATHLYTVQFRTYLEKYPDDKVLKYILNLYD